MILIDSYNRVHDYLRFSLSDKCNLNCVYCNPAVQNLKQLRKDEILTNEEIIRLLNIFVKHFEFKKIRFTGGEPLIRKDIIDLFSELKPLHENYGLEIGITTNGILLCEIMNRLKESGVTKLNISLDTLQEKRFMKITGKDRFNEVMDSIMLAEELGFYPLKINCVVMKGINDDEIIDFVNFVKNKEMNIRFIEYMPFSGNGWHEGKFIGCQEIKTVIENKFCLTPFISNKNEVANNFKISGHKGMVSFISSISNHFCERCSRLRITSEGNLKLCLFSPVNKELSLKEFLKNNTYSDEESAGFIQSKVQEKEYIHPGIDDLLKLEKNNMLSIGG